MSATEQTCYADEMDTSIADLETALAESVHRARNDLQAVVSMLRLQARAVADPAAREALYDAVNRIQALAHLNARLDGRAIGPKSVIDGLVFFEGLGMDIRSMHFGQRPIELIIEAQRRPIPTIQAKPLGLILNELMLNALKYAFPEDRSGEVKVEFVGRKSGYVLSVKDNGVGIDISAPPRGTGIGMRMIKALVVQVGGSFNIGPGARGGTQCVMQWPAPA